MDNGNSEVPQVSPDVVGDVLIEYFARFVVVSGARIEDDFSDANLYP